MEYSVRKQQGHFELADEKGNDSQLTMPGSEDSDEDLHQEEPPVTSWSELSIIDRVGLNSVEMSEKAVEAAFCQITLAFHCDQYTLKQRLQAEEHARNLAEENVQMELTRGRETLESLKALCLDSTRSHILQRLELCLDILGGTVERIANTAEVLGAVHQEARVSRAVELMVAHVENLKRRNDRDAAELEETKRLLRRTLTEPRVMPVAETDEQETKRMKTSQQHSGRIRVRVSVISKQTQEMRKQRDLRKQVTEGKWSKEKALPVWPPPTLGSQQPPCSAVTRDDMSCMGNRLLVEPDDTTSESSVCQTENSLHLSPTPNPECPTPTPKNVKIQKTANKTTLLDTLRQRNKGKAVLSQKKINKDKKSTARYQQGSVGLCIPLQRQLPVGHWISSCQWALLCTALLVCVVYFLVYLINLPGPAL